MKFPSIRTWLYVSLGLLPLTVAAYIKTPGHLLDAEPLYGEAIPLGIAIGAFYARYALHWKTVPVTLPSWCKQWYWGFWLSCLATLLIGTLFRCINIGFDQSAPQHVRLTVLHQYIAPRSRGRSSSLNLVVSNSLLKGRRASIAVGEKFYLAHPVGSSFPVQLHQGALGAVWVEPLNQSQLAKL